jgi:hypothetical protein
MTATGQPIICVVIISGKTIQPEAIFGLDLFATQIDDESDPEYITNNTGSRNLP